MKKIKFLYKKIFINILVLILCLQCIGENLVTVYAEEAEGINFNLYTYRADKYLEHDSVCNKTIQNMMTMIFPSQLIVYNLNEEDAFQNEVNAWKSIHYAKSPSEIAEGGIDEKGYYEAIILSIFVSQSTAEHNEFDFGKKTALETDTVLSNMKNWVEESDQFELEKVSKNQTISTLSIEEKDEIEKYLKKEFSDNHPLLDATSNISDALSICFSSVETVGEAVELMAYYSGICDLSFETKEVLMDMYEKCPDSNLALKSALDEVALSMEHYNLGVGAALLNAAGETFVDGIGAVVDDLVSTGWDYVFKANPYIKAFSFGADIGIEIGDVICNNLFSTDKTIEQYQKMKCLCEFTELIKIVVNDMEEVYLTNSTEENAKKYFASIDALFTVAELSCDYASDYGDIIYTDSLVGQIQYLFSEEARENFDTYVSSIASIKKIYEQEQQSLINNYLSNLEYEYPDIYARLMGEEISYIKVSGIEFTDDELIVGLEDDYIYNVGIPDVYPQNATDRTIQYFSSDESIIEIDKNGGWLNPREKGTAIVTATSVDGSFSDTIQVTVVDGTSERWNKMELALFVDGDGSMERPYLIYSEKGLDAIRNDLSANYVLVADIYMNSTENWERIGTKYDHFTGSLNGNNHSVYNFNVDGDSLDYNGLFSYLQDAVVKNINFINAYMYVYGDYLGIIAGQADNSLIINCHVDGTVEGPGDYGNYAGGIVGVNNKGIIQGCTFRGTVSGCGTTGGIAAKSSGIISDCACFLDLTREYSWIAGGIGSGPGGIVGLNTGSIQCCYNTNEVWGNTWSGSNGAGGIAGQNKGTIKYCYNEGYVHYACAYWHNGYVGGICGRNEAEILDCYNLGKVSSDRSHVCGIAAEENVSNSIIKNCYNIGILEGGNEKYNREGYNYGISDGNNIENCYYLESISVDGKGNRCTVEELSNESTYEEFDFEHIWFFSSELDYPQLNMALSYNVIPVIKVSKESGNISIDELPSWIENYDVEQLVFGESKLFDSAKEVVFDVETSIRGNKSILLQTSSSKDTIEMIDQSMISNNTIAFEIVKSLDSVIVYGYNGDIDADEKISIKDMMQMLHFISGRTSLSEVQKGFADIDMNNTINLQDLMREMHCVSGRTEELY